ncbi:MAG: CHASE domain-containing protein [Candidatus Omnitrophica bacterium]|nr:CHASE domain-containing protein [Candidatus Omnitrophota bacterium]
MRRHLSALLVVLVGIVFSLLAFHGAQSAERQRRYAAFQEQAAQLAAAVQQQFDEAVEALESTGAFYASSESVSREAFRFFVRGLLAKRPALHALAWAPLVPAAERSTVEEAARQDGLADFAIREVSAQGELVPAGTREMYVPFLFVEAVEGDPSRLGFDLLSEPRRRYTLTKAGETATACATPRVALVQPGGFGAEEGLYIVLPVYHSKTPPQTAEDRRRQLRGFIVSTHRTPQLIKAALRRPATAGMTIRITDETASASDPPMYESGTGFTSPFHWATVVRLPGRSWGFEAWAAPAFGEAQRTRQPEIVLVSGLLLTLLLGLYMHQLAGYSARVEALVGQRTAELSRVNQELERKIEQQRRSEAQLEESDQQLREKAATLERTVEELTRREQITQSLLDDLQESRERSEAAHAALKQSHADLQAAQLQLIQAAKLESVGRLAAGVAHEVKNPLAIILMGTAFLQKQLGGADELVTSVVGDIDKAVKRADTIIRGLLDFAAFKELRQTTEAVNGVVEQALLLVKHELNKANVTVVTSLAPEVPSVAMDRTKIEQVLVNLFANAAHAMSGSGGTLTVRTFVKPLTQVGMGVGQRSTDQFKVGEAAVVIEVDDTGKGIPPELLVKVFDPFFTTKPPGQGTGLGLSVTRSIIELHRGMIDLRNRPEGGVRATIMLHLTEAQKPMLVEGTRESPKHQIPSTK